MFNVSRQEFMSQLESISPGLSPREIIEQSSCFVFEDGYVMTYNDEVACKLKLDMDITGAVQAKPLMAVLQRLPEETIKIKVDEGEMRVIGKRRQAGIRMDNDVTLPFKNVDTPKKYQTLHEDFLDAISMVSECAGTDENMFWTTCVHIHPKWVEACDNFQITRCRMPTGIKEATLVRNTAIKHIVQLEMKQYCLTSKWLHFRNKQGLVLSCRRYTEDFPSLKNFIALENGTPTTLPKGLAEAAERANIFSEENADNNLVSVVLKPGKLRIKGEGVSGWFSETKKIKYKGSPLEFMIAPKLLVEITKRHNDCEISADKLKVNGGKFVYVSLLGNPEDEELDNENEDQDQDEENEREEGA